MSARRSVTVITFGTYDLLHIGHVRILERAAALGDRMVVGVSSDALNLRKKGSRPQFPEDHRLEIVASLRCVDEVFLEESLEEKLEYVQKYHADVLVMGDDWAGKFDWLLPHCEVVYLPRTPEISTTSVRETIQSLR
jgi:glycerol-3-phosphate cytidylyltransferase